jgi:hypothetical protein
MKNLKKSIIENLRHTEILKCLKGENELIQTDKDSFLN